MYVTGEYGFQVRSYECGPDGAATLPTVCNYLQEAASLNAEALAFSRSNFAAEGENISWVLTRLRVQMARFPRWEEKVRVVTWPSGGRRVAATREFELRDAAGARLGVATSEWMLIDLASRRIVAIPEQVFACVQGERPPRVLGDAPFGKLRWDCRETSGAQVFRARRGDIDLNGHVNNVHYVEWLVETVPPGAGCCTDFEIVFRSETLAGEEVRAEGVEVEPGVYAHRLSAPDGRDHVLARTRWMRLDAATGSREN